MDPATIVALVVGVISAGIAGWSAAIAAKAARVSADSLRDQRDGRRAALNADYYRAVVVGPAMIEIPKFIRETSEILERAQAEIRGATDGHSPADSLKRTRSLTEQYRRRHRDFEIQLLAAARGWGDDEFFRAIGERLDQLEDEVTLAVAHLSSESASSESVGELLVDRASGLLGAIVLYGRDLAEPPKLNASQVRRALPPNTADK